MKTTLQFVTTLALVAGLANAQDKAVVHDFRSVDWGMTIAQVKAVEGEPQLAKTNVGLTVLLYPVTVGTLSANVIFVFATEANQLLRTRYVFSAHHSEAQVYISDFEGIDKTLTEKYGEPSAKNTNWVGSNGALYRTRPEHAGMAVLTGGLQYLTEWKGLARDGSDKHMRVAHALTGDNYRATHAVEYVCLELEGLEKQAKEKAGSGL